jgi:hypothetical protein
VPTWLLPQAARASSEHVRERGRAWATGSRGFARRARSGFGGVRYSGCIEHGEVLHEVLSPATKALPATATCYHCSPPRSTPTACSDILPRKRQVVREDEEERMTCKRGKRDISRFCQLLFLQKLTVVACRGLKIETMVEKEDKLFRWLIRKLYLL